MPSKVCASWAYASWLTPTQNPAGQLAVDISMQKSRTWESVCGLTLRSRSCTRWEWCCLSSKRYPWNKKEMCQCTCLTFSLCAMISLSLYAHKACPDFLHHPQPSKVSGQKAKGLWGQNEVPCQSGPWQMVAFSYWLGNIECWVMFQVRLPFLTSLSASDQQPEIPPWK